MPKRVDGYECSKCSTFYKTEIEASSCEAQHPTIESMKITNASFRSTEGLWGSQRDYAGRFPDSINVKFSDEFGHFARYILEHAGHKGV